MTDEWIDAEIERYKFNMNLYSRELNANIHLDWILHIMGLLGLKRKRRSNG